MACGNVPLRLIIGGMMCLISMVHHFVRGNMSIIILAMTKPLYNTTEPVPNYGPRYEWSAYDQSLVIGSYFCGSFLVTFFAGVIAERYGPRKVGGFGIILGAILSAVAPIAANNLWLSIFVRFLTGISMGTLSPAMQSIIANWVPPQEKGKFLSTLFANSIGTVIDWSMSGYIIQYLGWQYAFYAVVLILIVITIAWFSVIYDSPVRHPSITTKEKEFILSKLKITSIKSKKPWPPLTSMMSSIPFWALVIFHSGGLFSHYIFFTATPKYLSEVHKFNIAKTGVLSSVPYVLRFLTAVGFGTFGMIGDYLFTKKIMSPLAIRKYFAIFSHVLPACMLIGLSYIGNRPYVSVAFISVANGLFGATNFRLYKTHMIFHTILRQLSIHLCTQLDKHQAPLVVAHYTKQMSTEREWRFVFLIGAGLLMGTAVIFAIFGSGTTQKWNKITESMDETNTEEDTKLKLIKGIGSSS